MGAAASFEIQKPVDASDIIETNSLEVALGEVVKLRAMLGHLAKENGFAEVVYNGSDLVLGVDDSEDFDRCVKEISHIRSCLQLSTQSAKRKTRTNYVMPVYKREDYDNEEDQSDSDSDSDEGGTGPTSGINTFEDEQ